MSIETEIFIFCENVKRLRAKEGLSKREISEILGISIRSLTMLEKGILPKNLCCDVLLVICNYFQLEPKMFFSGLISLGDNHTKLNDGRNEL